MTNKTWIFALLAVAALRFTCTNPNSAGNGSQTGNPPVVASMLYNPDGTPAVHATVRFFPVNYNPRTGGLSKALAAVDSTTTDANGNYSATLDSGTYNIFASGGGNLAFQDSITAIKDSTIHPPTDTLKAPGSIKGVVKLEPAGDARTVFILFMGTRTFTIPNDSIGNFTTDNIAEGQYRVKILTTTPNYGVLDTMLSVIAGTQNVLADTIRLPFNGIPVPSGLKVSYDTLKQIVTLTWNKADTALVKSYNVYRRNVDSNTVAVRINASPVTDTVYRDSTGVQGQTYEYRVAAVGKSAAEGGQSAGMSTILSSAFKLLDSLYLGYSYGSSATIYNGDSLFADRTNDKITIIDTSLKVLSSFDLPSGFGNGVGHEIDKTNRVWASNYNTGRVNIYSSVGILVDSVTDVLLRFPTVLRSSPDGRMFINSEVSPNVEQIRIYDDSARFVSLLPSDSLPILTKIADMFFDIQGNLTVLDDADSSITIYNTSGALIKKQKLPSYTVEIGQLSNGYYIIKQDGGTGIIHLLDASFSLVSIFGTGLGFDYRDFGSIAVDGFDRLVVRRGNSVLLYSISK